jgi:hypothetical protein
MSNRINEIDDFNEKIMFTYVEHLRYDASQKFCKWKGEFDLAKKKVIKPTLAEQAVPSEIPYNSVNTDTRYSHKQDGRPRIPEFPLGGSRDKIYSNEDGQTNRKTPEPLVPRPVISARGSSKGDLFLMPYEEPIAAPPPPAAPPTSAQQQGSLKAGFYGSLKKSLQKKK